MKNIILALAIIIIVPSTTLAQDNDLKKLFGKYKNVPGFELEKESDDINIDLDGDFDLANFLNNIEGLYVLNFEYSEGNLADLTNFKNKLKKLTDKKDFSTMIDIQGDERFAIMIRKNDSGQTTDALMISEEDNESTFIWAAGK